MQSMEEEHCEIEPGDAKSGVWGASDRPWTTGNYGLTTTPHKEWRWTKHLEWDGVRVEQTIGGYEKDGGSDGTWSNRENISVQRKAVPIDELSNEAPRRIFAMLHELAAKRGEAKGEGTVEDSGCLTEEDVSAGYEKLNMNTAELLGLRLYTGPLFEFYNSVLRAKGGTVPFGDRYPALKGEQTSGRFVTTIHAVSPRDTR